MTYQEQEQERLRRDLASMSGAIRSEENHLREGPTQGPASVGCDRAPQLQGHTTRLQSARAELEKYAAALDIRAIRIRALLRAIPEDLPADADRALWEMARRYRGDE